MNDEFQLIRSSLCQEITSNGDAVQVEIYRGADDKTWTLEVVNEYGTPPYGMMNSIPIMMPSKRF